MCACEGIVFKFVFLTIFLLSVGYYRDGRYERTFYSMPVTMYQLQRQRPIVGPFWAREFEVASKDIDDYYQR